MSEYSWPDNIDLTVKNKVGIGIDKPTEKLEVEGTVKATEFVGDGSKLTNLNRWSLAYAHDANGNRTAGNINDLITAVQNGSQVRVLMDSGVQQAITYAEYILVKNGIVYVQNTSIVSARFDGDVFKFMDDSFWWMIIVSTKADRDIYSLEGRRTYKGRSWSYSRQSSDEVVC